MENQNEENHVIGTPIPHEPPYAKLTNQDILNIFYHAAGPDQSWEWVLQAGLKGLAGSPEFRKEIYAGPKIEDLPGLSEDQKQALLNKILGNEPVHVQQKGWVKVAVSGSPCQSFKTRDKANKPVMIPHKPGVLLTNGARLRVSLSHKESEMDAGDGVIWASGRKAHYLIEVSPDNPDAAGLFIQKESTLPIPDPGLDLSGEGLNNEESSIDGKTKDESALVDPSEKEGSAGDPGFWLKISSEKSACQYYKKQDGAGKPVMIPIKPRVLLLKGNRLRVSGDYKISDLDKGDGVIWATGRRPHYKILESPDNPDAVGLFVQREDTQLTAG